MNLDKACRVRLFIIGVLLTFLAGLPVQAASPCSNGGFKVGFVLTLTEANTTPKHPDLKGLHDLLLSVSRLHEKTGDCLRSIARVDANLQGDIESFQRVLRSEGYYAASVDYRANRSAGAVELVVVIHPGQPYRVGSVALAYVGVSEGQEDLALAAPLAKGAVGKAIDIVGGELALVTALTEKGYPFAAAEDRRVVVDHATATLSVEYRLNTGPKARFGAITYEGTELTKHSFLDRLVPWQPQSTYNRAELEKLRTRLMETGLFRLATVSVGKPDTGIDEVPVSVTVEEALPRRIELGAGYSTGEGIATEASWSHRNAFGSGEHLKFALALGESEQTVEANMRKPQYRRYGQAAILNARFGRENIPAYTSYLVEAFAGLERQYGKRLTGSLGVSGKAEKVVQGATREEYIIAGLPAGIAYDTSDILLDPHEGFRVNMRLQPSVSLINDSTLFLIGELRASAYWQPDSFEALTLAVRGRAGFILGPERDSIPLTERFYAGGGGSVRGFSYQAVGPQDANGDPIGGLSVAEVGLEARFRVSKTISLVPFLDGGAIYASNLPDFNAFRWGAGLGIRYHTTIAPIRLDIATPLDRREGESRIGIYLSIGQSF